MDGLRAFGIEADQWTTAAQDEREWRETAEQKAERFMAKLIATEKARAELRHAAVCPNVTGRTKERKAQSKRARDGSLAIIDKPQVARTCILRVLFYCRYHTAFLWRYVFSSLFCFCFVFLLS